MLFKSLLFFLLLISFSFSSCLKNTGKENKNNASIITYDEKPNVIIILSDDQGYGDFSCHGHPILKTPALDKLYVESIRLSDFHVTPLCTPTRGQLLTGLDAFHNKAATVLTARNIIRRDLKIMPELFKNGGYATGIFGKWHLGDNYPDRPMDKGFEKCIWHRGWGLLSEMEYDNDYYETRYMDGLEIKYSRQYCTNLWFDKSIEWMNEQAKEKTPFFSYISLNAPHGPFDSQMQDYNVFKDDISDQETASFLGMIRNIDRNMAHLDTWLDESGLKENTIVIYMNDNGTALGEKVYNANLRGKKGSIYEGGHRAACFIHWPAGNLGSPRDIDYPSQVQDILPTILALTGVKAEIPYNLDGINLAESLLSSNTIKNDRMFVVQYGGHEKPEKYYSCVVWNSWRLIGNDELYNLDSDIGQQNNVAEKYPEILHKMRTHYENWWAGTETELDKFVPTIIGSSKQNPVVINSTSWVFNAINTQWAVAGGRGKPRGGISHLHALEAGEYRIDLSRWPFHLNRELTISGQEYSIGGTKIWSGKALPITTGCISINGNNEIISKAKPGATKISFEMELKKGDFEFQAWFRDETSKDLCGAYYVQIEKI